LKAIHPCIRSSVHESNFIFVCASVLPAVSYVNMLISLFSLSISILSVVSFALAQIERLIPVRKADTEAAFDHKPFDDTVIASNTTDVCSTIIHAIHRQIHVNY
jgi:hypothetical protein